MKKNESILSIETDFDVTTTPSNLSIETTSLCRSVSLASLSSDPDIMLKKSFSSDMDLHRFDRPITKRDLLLRKKYEKGRYAYSPEKIQDISSNSCNDTTPRIHSENAGDYWQPPRSKSPSPSKCLVLMGETEILLNKLKK